MIVFFKKPVVILFAIFYFTNYHNGQCQEIGANLSFDKLFQNIGNIADHDGPIECVFEFINTGSIPVAIEKVKSPCGCTVPEYTSDYIHPGEKSKINLTVYPDRIPSGNFRRGVTIITKPDEKEYNLFIEGVVLQRFKEIYGLDLGAIRLKDHKLRFGVILKGESKTITTGTVNVSGHPVHLSFAKLPPFLTVEATPAILNPDEKGQLHITFNTTKTNRWGLIADTTVITIKNNEILHKKLNYIVNIKEDFSTLSERKRKNAPKISFNRTLYNLGKIPRDTVITKKFIYKNKGNRKLVIRDFMNYCKFIDVVCEDKKIKPGKKGEIIITYKPGKKEECKRATITVVSNDPETPWVKLKINSMVKKQ